VGATSRRFVYKRVSRAVSVAREASLWTSSGPPLLELPFRSGSVRRHLVPFRPTRQRPVRPRGPRLPCINPAEFVPHESVMSREEIIGRDDECYGHRRCRLLIRGTAAIEVAAGVQLDLNSTGLACFMLVDLDRPNARIEERPRTSRKCGSKPHSHSMRH
jgi:hypothetical protein